MLISEEMEIWDQTVGKALEHAAWKNEGIQVGQTDVAELFSWLFKNERIDDAIKASNDHNYLSQLLSEYRKVTNPVT